MYVYLANWATDKQNRHRESAPVSCLWSATISFHNFLLKPTIFEMFKGQRCVRA